MFSPNKPRQPFSSPSFWATLVVGAFLLCWSNPASAQDAGPLAPATPSDQPLASAAPQAQAPAKDRIGDKPNLGGTWKENKKQSDDPREKMRQAAQQSQNNDTNANSDANQGPNGGFGGRPGYGGGPYGGANGGPYGGPNNGQGNESEPPAPRGDEQLVIEQTPTSARVSNGSGRLIAAYAATPEDQPSAPSDDANASDANGGRRKRRNRNAPAVAQWDGDRLVTTTEMGGGSMTRVYELSPDGQQLIVTTKIENRRSDTPVTYRLVYDPVTVSNDGKNK